MQHGSECGGSGVLRVATIVPFPPNASRSAAVVVGRIRAAIVRDKRPASLGVDGAMPEIGTESVEAAAMIRILRANSVIPRGGKLLTNDKAVNLVFAKWINTGRGRPKGSRLESASV